jgi:hypothetical protein
VSLQRACGSLAHASGCEIESINTPLGGQEGDGPASPEAYLLDFAEPFDIHSAFIPLVFRVNDSLLFSE